MFGRLKVDGLESISATILLPDMKNFALVSSVRRTDGYLGTQLAHNAWNKAFCKYASWIGDWSIRT